MIQMVVKSVDGNHAPMADFCDQSMVVVSLQRFLEINIESNERSKVMNSDDDCYCVHVFVLANGGGGIKLS